MGGDDIIILIPGNAGLGIFPVVPSVIGSGAVVQVDGVRVPRRRKVLFLRVCPQGEIPLGGIQRQADGILRLGDPALRVHHVALSMSDPALYSVPVHAQSRYPAPVGVPVLVLSADGLRHHGHLVRRVHEPGVILFGFFRPAAAGFPGGGAGAGHFLPDDACHVFHGVGQRDGDGFLFLLLVPPLHPGDVLQDESSVFRQRHPAGPADPQPVQGLSGRLAQLQPGYADGYAGLAVSPQPSQGPQPQIRLRFLRLVGFHLHDGSIGALVHAQIASGDVQVILPDGINPGIHPAGVHRALNRADVPPHPHFAAGRGFLRLDVNLEGINRKIIAPPAVFQRGAHGLDGLIDRVPVEAVSGGYAVSESVISRHYPVALPAQRVPDGRLRGHGGFAPAHVLGLDLPEDGRVLQNLDNVLRRDGPGLRAVVVFDGPDPVDDPGPRFLIVHDPLPGFHLRRLRPDGELDLPVFLRHVQPAGLRLECAGPVQAVRLQQYHLTATSRSFPS